LSHHPSPEMEQSAMKRIVGPVIAIVAATSLNGCMMGGGMAGMEGMHGVRPTPDSMESMIGEVRTAALHVTLEVQGFPAGGDARILVRVRDGATSDPVRDAIVRLVVEPAGDAMSTILPVTQTAPGTYEATYRYTAPGAFKVMAEVLPDGGDARAVATLAVRREATPAIQTSGRRSPLLAAGLLGSVAMAAMMVAMLAR
jgi:hypothetical protein